MHVELTLQRGRVLPPSPYPELAPLRGTQYAIGDLCRFLQVEVPKRLDMDNTSFLLTTLRRRENLYRTGCKFENLYLVLSGLLMTSLFDEDEIERPVSFPSRGDIVGVDGIECGKYCAETTALTPSLILILPFKTVRTGSEKYAILNETFGQLICRELVGTRVTRHVIRNFRSEARVAHFLLEIAQKLTSSELPLHPFRLPISRREIGHFLSLTYETISRTLTAFHNQRIINVKGSDITLLDIPRLAALKPSSAVSAQWNPDDPIW